MGAVPCGCNSTSTKVKGLSFIGIVKKKKKKNLKVNMILLSNDNIFALEQFQKWSYNILLSVSSISSEAFR